MVELAINIVAFVICAWAAIFVGSAVLWLIAAPFRVAYWIAKLPKKPALPPTKQDRELKADMKTVLSGLAVFSVIVVCFIAFQMIGMD